MKPKPLLKSLLLFIVFMLFKNTAFSQHLDEVFFGDTTSERNHGISTFKKSASEIYTGQNGLKARRFLPNNANPYQGSYTGIYGGEIHIVMKVDSTQQNYFTMKFAGNEVNNGRIILNVESRELGSRHGGDEELFWDASEDGTAVSPGAFFYRTAPIPRTLTNGKSYVVIRLRSSGSFFAYGTPFVYNTYQNALTTKTCGMYAAYTHTNPAFTLPAYDVQGNTPNYAVAPAKGTSDLAAIKANTISKINSRITDLLNGSDYIPSDPNNYFNNIEVLGVAYNQPEITAAYHNPAVVVKIKKAVDNLVINSNNGKQTAPDGWGGAFGHPAYAVALVYNALTGLDSVVNLGGGSGLTRRQQWISLFKASFNYGAGRMTISNQELENDHSTYGAALGLYKLDPVNYAQYPKVALHLVLEACGIEEFTGGLTNLNTNNPTLGSPAASTKGAGFYSLTQKGTSHEPGWVAPDCYGNLGPKLIEIYKMSQIDPNITAYGVGNGDTRILTKAVQHNKMQATFSYPWTLNNNRIILSEGAICWRNVYIPGKEFYGSAVVAGLANDAVSVGYMKQMVQDGNFDFDSEDPKRTYLQYLPAAIDNIVASGSTSRMPSSPDQPDYTSADEENGVVAIKNGSERVFVTLYDRAYSDNKLAKAHQITTTTERKIEFKPDKTEFSSSGQYKVRGPSVAGDYSGEAPDAPISGYSGQIEYYPSYNRTGDYKTDRCILEFYQARFGKYMIAMNTTTDLTKTITFPADMVGKSGYDIGSASTTSIPATVTVGPRSTKVFYVAAAGSSPGLIADTRPAVTGVNKSALLDSIAFTENFATQDSIIAKVSVKPKAGNYKYDLFNDLVAKIALAKYISLDTLASQANVNLGKTKLMTAYYLLVGNKYSTSTNLLESGIYFIKIPNQNSVYTKNNSTIPLFDTLSLNKDPQRWNITKEANGRYKMVNISNNGYLNENAKFGTNAYDSDWNTMQIIGNGTTYAIQKAGNAGNGYWYISGNQILTQDGSGNPMTPASFPFELKPDIYVPLDLALKNATALNDSAQTTTTQQPGKYPVAAKTAFSNVITGTRQAYNSYNTVQAINAAADSLNNAIITFKKTMYVQQNTLESGVYFIKIPNLNSVYTKNSTNIPLFDTLNLNKDLQRWNITKEANGRYKMVNISNDGYLNENAKFGTNAYDSNWNTMQIIWNGTTYAIQKAGNAGNGYWYISGNQILTQDGSDPAALVSFPFELKLDMYVPLDLALKNATTLNNSAQTTTAQDPGKYPVAAKTAFNNIISSTKQAYSSLNTNQAINAAADSLNNAILTFKKSMYFQRNMLAPGKYYIKLNDNYYTANTSVPFGFSPKIATADSTTQIWNISLSPVTGGAYWVQNQNTQAYWNEWAKAIKKPAQLSDEGDWILFNAYYNGKNYAIQKRAPGQGDQYFNGVVDNGIAVFNNTFADPSYYIFKLIPVLSGQTVSFNNLAKKRAGDTDVPLTATASSGLPVSYASSDTTVATILNGKLHIKGAGTSTITAWQPGNGNFAASSVVSQQFMVSAINLQARYKDGDNQPGNNLIKPYLQIVNTDSIAVSYSELTIRYWFTAENYALINTWIDYAQMGNAKVKMKYVASAQPRSGALGYIEYSFDAGAGLLAAGGSSGEIQSRLANSDWAVMNESDDYSHMIGTAYVANDNITIYRNGVLIHGTEPQVVTAVKAVKVYYQNKNNGNSGSAISSDLTLSNEGNIALNYKDITIRYWFTKDGTSALNYWIDYAKLQAQRIAGGFVSISPATAKADTYFELKIDSASGSLYPLSNTGSIQYRIAKADWSVMNEVNDYSYKTAAPSAANDHIGVYVKGQLIYGVEPSASMPGSFSLASNQLGITDNSSLMNQVEVTKTIVYPNPVTGSYIKVNPRSKLIGQDINIVIYDFFGKKMLAESVRNYQGGPIPVNLNSKFTQGNYFIRVNSDPSTQFIVH